MLGVDRPLVVLVCTACICCDVAESFVLSGASTLPPASLPGSAYRWSVPAPSHASAGLGGGIRHASAIQTLVERPVSAS
jgi:hypothetical protein